MNLDFDDYLLLLALALYVTGQAAFAGHMWHVAAPEAWRWIPPERLAALGRFVMVDFAAFLSVLALWWARQ